MGSKQVRNMNGPLLQERKFLNIVNGVGSKVNNEQNSVNVVRERPLIFVFVRKDERLRDRNKLLRGNDQLNVQIHSQLFPISLFLCTLLCNHGLFMFRRKIQLRTYFLHCEVLIYFFYSIFSSFGFWYFDHFSCVIFLTCFFSSCPSCLTKCKQRLRSIFVFL